MNLVSLLIAPVIVMLAEGADASGPLRMTIAAVAAGLAFTVIFLAKRRAGGVVQEELAEV